MTKAIMTKESKTGSTIRRRKGKEVAHALMKIKEEIANSVESSPNVFLASDSDIQIADKEEKCYLFDDRVLGPMILRRLMSQPSSLFLALLAIRCANALLIQTQYVPDEYWQSVEVAHTMVFGYGYLTWEWQEGLRGYSYPLVFAVFYKLLYILGLDSRVLLIKLPKLIQACVAAWGDFHLYELSAKLAGRSAAQWTLLCQLLSWFTIYCTTRTLSNSTETSLMLVALNHFPWPSQQVKGNKNNTTRNNVSMFLLYAALSVIVRPTSAVVWVLMCCWHLQLSRHLPSFKSLLHTYLFVGLTCIAASALVDRIWYGRWVFVQLNFVLFNVMRGGASIYGTHPWHWYISQGFPVIMGTMMFPFAVGAWRAKDKTLLWISLWILATHSLLPHKEFRFILPAVPLAMHYCGLYFQQLCTRPLLKEVKAILKSNASNDAALKKHGDGSKTPEKSKVDVRVATPEHKAETKSDALEDEVAAAMDVLDSLTEDGGDGNTVAEEEKKDGDSQPAMDKKGGGDVITKDIKAGGKEVDPSDSVIEVEREHLHKSRLLKARVLTTILVVTNLLPALYFCLIHQRGTIMVTKFLADAAAQKPAYTDILFLMPCHSTPYYSYIHSNVSMRFLSCDPPGVFPGSQNRSVLHPHHKTKPSSPSSPYVDEADRFFRDPEYWLKYEYGRSDSIRRWPSHLVFYSSLHHRISGVLVKAGYKMCGTFFHTHFPEDRVGAHVLVSCR